LVCRGNGFITDTNIIRKYGISDANYFFSQLVSKPYVNKVGMCSLCSAGTACCRGLRSALCININV